MKFRSLNPTSLSQTRNDWLTLLTGEEHEVFLADYEQIFNTIEATDGIGELNGVVNKAIHYALFDESNEKCHALVQLVQSRRGNATWVKMMDIFLSPAIEQAPDDEPSTQMRLRVFGEVLKGIFNLTASIRLADTVKVYGRTDALVTFLRGMHDSFSVIASLGTLKGIEVSIEGRWLVFRSTGLREE